MYTMILADGTKLESLELNGNNFISEAILEDAVFQNNLSTVIIIDGETTETYTDMRLLANRVADGKTWFVIGEKSDDYKQKERLNLLEEENKYLKETLEIILSGETEVS